MNVAITDTVNMDRKEIISLFPPLRLPINDWAKEVEAILMELGNSDNEILARRFFRSYLNVWKDPKLEFADKTLNCPEQCWSIFCETFMGHC